MKPIHKSGGRSFEAKMQRLTGRSVSGTLGFRTTPMQVGRRSLFRIIGNWLRTTWANIFGKPAPPVKGNNRFDRSQRALNQHMVRAVAPQAIGIRRKVI